MNTIFPIGALLLLNVLSSDAAPVQPVQRKPFLAGIFTDNMVLQRDMADPIWGWTTPGATITVSVDGVNIRAKTTAGADGKWRVKLKAPPVGGPYKIKIVGLQSVTLTNVLVGDVWLCAGQSNMGLSVNEADNAVVEIADAGRPDIRLMSLNMKIGLAPSSEMDGQWRVCSPETVARFSAVGYFFGRKLNENLKIPIGLINLGWGGTSAETWISGPTITQVEPSQQTNMNTLARSAAGEDIYAAWYAANDPGSANSTNWASPAFDDSAWVAKRLPNVPEWGVFGDLWNVYTGTLWFRNIFDLPVVAGDMTLNFSGAGVDTVWVNGEKVGTTLVMKPRSYHIPAHLLKPGMNLIALRFLQMREDEMLGVNCRADRFTLVSASGEVKSLAGNWKFKLGVPLKNAAALPLVIEQNTPSVVYNGTIAPLAPFGIKGTIWYQGETDTGDHAFGYRKLLQALIGNWRALWGQGEFPFYIVQLPFYGPAQTDPGERDLWRNWLAEIRESQAWVADHVHNSGLAVTLELGNATNVHTTHKLEVGHRLALLALANTYGQRMVYSGPVYRSLKVEGNGIQLHFDLNGSHLATRDNAPLVGFAIAGEDHKWVWGEARIVRDSILVSSPKVLKPVAVRYAWSANPVGNLINQSGLPASPFRTDTWPTVSKDY